MRPQVLVVAGSDEGNVTAWDLATGSSLTSYKGNACPTNGLTLVGTEYLMACQTTKAGVHAWSWEKDQVLVRSFAPEPLQCISGSHCGTYLAGGGASGSIHLWCVRSGRLYRSWPAHFKAVTCLQWTPDASALVSAGGDGAVSVWLVPDLLDDPRFAPPSVQPWRTVAAHSLSITGLQLDPTGTVAVSVGLDCAVAVTSLTEAVSSPGGTAAPLARFVLPTPLHAVVLDVGGGAAFVGGADGIIYEVCLTPVQTELQGGMNHSTQNLEGHSGPVSALRLAGPDGSTLVSGSADGTVRVWELRARQQLRCVEKPLQSGPVTALIVLDRPPAMLAGGSKGRSRAGAAEQDAAVLAPLSRFIGSRAGVKPWEDVVARVLGRADTDMQTELEEMLDEQRRLEHAGPVLAVPEGPEFIPLGNEAAGTGAQTRYPSLESNGQQAPAQKTAKGRKKARGKRQAPEAEVNDTQEDISALRSETEKLKQQLERASHVIQKLMDAQRHSKK